MRVREPNLLAVMHCSARRTRARPSTRLAVGKGLAVRSVTVVTTRASIDIQWAQCRLTDCACTLPPSRSINCEHCEWHTLARNASAQNAAKRSDAHTHTHMMHAHAHVHVHVQIDVQMCNIVQEHLI